MSAIRLLLYIALLILSIITLTKLLQRRSRLKQIWPIKEPEFRRFIEERTGQQIRETIEVPASATTDFQQGLTLWAAFTPDYIAYIIKESVLANNNALVSVQRKDETVITEGKKRLKSQLIELKRNEYPNDEADTIILLFPQDKYEVLKQQVRNLRPRQK